MAQPVEHYVCGFDVAMQIIHLVKTFQPAEYATQQIHHDSRLKAHPVSFKAENCFAEVRPFIARSVFSGNLQMLFRQEKAKINTVYRLHLDIADAMGFLIGMFRNEVGALTTLQL